MLVAYPSSPLLDPALLSHGMARVAPAPGQLPRRRHALTVHRACPPQRHAEGNTSDINGLLGDFGGLPSHPIALAAGGQALWPMVEAGWGGRNGGLGEDRYRYTLTRPRLIFPRNFPKIFCKTAAQLCAKLLCTIHSPCAQAAFDPTPYPLPVVGWRVSSRARPMSAASPSDCMCICTQFCR
jgi:hypothetical protein